MAYIGRAVVLEDEDVDVGPPKGQHPCVASKQGVHKDVIGIGSQVTWVVGQHPWVASAQAVQMLVIGGLTHGRNEETPVAVVWSRPHVKVSPSVVTVVGLCKPVGTVIVKLPPMTITPELDTSDCPSGNVVVKAPVGILLGGAVGGEKVNVSPSVVRVVGPVMLGIDTVSLPPMISTPELETSV